MMLFALALQVAASATSPPVAVPPLIASEIKRGWIVAHTCAGPKQWTPISTCLSDALDKNRRENPDKRGFGLGVSVATWAMARDMIPSLEDGSKDQDFAKSTVRLARIEAQGRAGRLGLTDADVPAVLPISADEWRAAADDRSPGR